MDENKIEVNLTVNGTNAADQAAAATKKIADSFTGLKSVMKDAFGVFTGNIFESSFTKMAESIKSVVVESTKYAARTQVLGTVMENMAKQHGISAQAIAELEAKVKALGITTQEARTTLTKFMSANLDVAKAVDLARVAQNAAVISGETTAEAMAGITHGLVTLQPEVLRQHGVMVNLDQAYKDFAKTNGITVESLTQQKKVQIALTEVQKYGVSIMGTYEAAMGDAGKRMTSLNRLWDEAKNIIGGMFQPALLLIVDSLEGMLGLFNSIGDAQDKAFKNSATLDGMRKSKEELDRISTGAGTAAEKHAAFEAALRTLPAASRDAIKGISDEKEALSLLNQELSRNIELADRRAKADTASMSLKLAESYQATIDKQAAADKAQAAYLSNEPTKRVVGTGPGGYSTVTLSAGDLAREYDKLKDASDDQVKENNKMMVSLYSVAKAANYTANDIADLVLKQTKNAEAAVWVFDEYIKYKAAIDAGSSTTPEKDPLGAPPKGKADPLSKIDAVYPEDEMKRRAKEIESLIRGGESETYNFIKRQAEKTLKLRRDSMEEERQISLIRLESQRETDLQSLESKRMDDQLMLDTGQITNEEFLKRELSFENARFEIEQAYLVARKKTYADDSAELAKLEAEMKRLEGEHGLESKGINNERNKESPKMLFGQDLKGGMQQAFGGIFTQAQSLTQRLNGLWRSAADSFYKNFVLKQVRDFAMGELLKISLLRNSKSVMAMLNAMGLAQESSALMASAPVAVSVNAAKAGAGAAASQAHIPIVGPILAIAAMGAMFAATMGMMGKVKSASGGYDIPPGLDPMTQLHQREMVLPAPLADRVRGMTEGGSGGVNLYLSALDRRSVSQMFDVNGKEIANALKKQIRRGGLRNV